MLMRLLSMAVQIASRSLPSWTRAIPPAQRLKSCDTVLGKGVEVVER